MTGRRDAPDQYHDARDPEIRNANLVTREFEIVDGDVPGWEHHVTDLTEAGVEVPDPRSHTQDRQNGC